MTRRGDFWNIIQSHNSSENWCLFLLWGGERKVSIHTWILQYCFSIILQWNGLRLKVPIRHCYQPSKRTIFWVQGARKKFIFPTQSIFWYRHYTFSLNYWWESRRINDSNNLKSIRKWNCRSWGNYRDEAVGYSLRKCAERLS